MLNCFRITFLYFCSSVTEQYTFEEIVKDDAEQKESYDNDEMIDQIIGEVDNEKDEEKSNPQGSEN